MRQSRAVQFARANQTLLLAVACLIVVALLSVFAQSGQRDGSDGTETAVAIAPTERGTATPTLDASLMTATPSGSPSPTGIAGVVDATRTPGTAGPNPPGRGTATPTRELPFGYPTPIDGPTGIGTIPVPTFPDPFTDDNTQSIPTFPPLPDVTTAPGTGGQPQRTAEPGDATPTPTTRGGGSGSYPTPSGEDDPKPTEEQAPTNIPVPTSDDGGFPTEEIPEPTFDDGGLPTEEPLPTPDDSTPTEIPPTDTPQPTATPSADTISGNVRWGAGQSPVKIKRDTIVAAGSTLTIEPGVEVQVAPDASLIVDGTLDANGARFRRSGATNWKSIVVNPRGRATLSGVDIRGGGSGGALIAALGGTTVINDSRIEGNNGPILGLGGNLDIQRSTIIGAAPLAVQVPGGGSLRLIGNTVSNTASDGSNGVAILAESGDVTIDVQRNLFKSSSGTNLRAQFNEVLAANFECNTFSGGSVGLQIKSTNPTLDGSQILITGNAFLNHRSYGLAGDVGVGARNNWWGDPSGPYHPEVNGTGTGDAVGINVTFDPWLQAKAACSP